MDMARTLRNRETTIRNFSDHVSHELKTSVAAMRAATELLQESETLDPVSIRLIDQIAGASTQMEDQLQAMRNVVKAREVRYLGTAFLRDVQKMLRVRYPEFEIRFSGGTVPIPLASQGLEIALGHLIDNANSHGATYIDLSAAMLSDGVILTITDDGTGISPGNAGRVFDPFFTTKRAQGGTGMGLSIVQNILRAHGASISTLPNEDGAIFTLTFAVRHATNAKPSDTSEIEG